MSSRGSNRYWIKTLTLQSKLDGANETPLQPVMKNSDLDNKIDLKKTIEQTVRVDSLNSRNQDQVINDESITQLSQKIQTNRNPDGSELGEDRNKTGLKSSPSTT